MMADELEACPFCDHAQRVKMLVENEEWCIARVACQAHKCGALGPWVELADFETVEEARAEAARLWNTRPLTGGVTEALEEARDELNRIVYGQATVARFVKQDVQKVAERIDAILSPNRSGGGDA